MNNNNPNHYNGSIQKNDSTSENTAGNDTCRITDEMRANISGNPFVEETTN